MKIRIADRVLVALTGVFLLALCACVVAQSFFDVPVTDTVKALLAGKQAVVWLPYALCGVLLALGIYCIALLFRRRRGKRGFVMQETDGGELSIALTAMDGLVSQCVAVHEEMKLLGSNVMTEHDGVTVELRVAMCSGVSVPLAVDALQKQIRQYVTACSGVAVREVRVQVDSMDSQPVETPYAVPAMLQSAVPAPLLTRGEEAEEKAAHQRIFSDAEEQAAPVRQEPAASVAETELSATEESPEIPENSEETCETCETSELAETQDRESAEETQEEEEPSAMQEETMAEEIAREETDEIAE